MSDVLRNGLALLALLFSMIVVMSLLFPQEIGDFLRRITKVELTTKGISITAAEENLKKAAKERNYPLPPEKELDAILQRVAQASRVLWVDDHPENNRYEIQALRDLGLVVDLASTNDEALQFYVLRKYSLIISDIGRDVGLSGLDLPNALAGKREMLPPIIHYVMSVSAPVTKNNHPVVNSPVLLMKLIAAVLG